MVAGAWDFERINRRYGRHLKILEERPGNALGNVAAAKALLRWRATEREAWLDAVINPESFRGCCRAGYCRRIIWGNKPGDGGWKCSGPPAGNYARSNPNSFPAKLCCICNKVSSLVRTGTDGLQPRAVGNFTPGQSGIASRLQAKQSWHQSL